MPGPIIRQSPLPWWADPKGASVFDVPGQGMLRQLVGWLGLDDPTQIMGLGVPIETGAATGGVLDLLAQKFPRLANAMKAYHGSPHDFERFDMSKIGTGEGAQAYGHGLYFAENQRVASEYQRNLSNFGFASAMPDDLSKSVLLDGKVVNGSTPSNQLTALERAALSKHYAGGNQARAIDELKDTLKYLEPGSPAHKLDSETLHVLETHDLTGRVRPFQGRMYEVAIHADPDQFLDWDKPLSQQSKEIQEKVARARGAKDVRPVRLKDGSYSVTTVQPDGSGRIIWDVQTPTAEQAMESYRNYVKESSGQEIYHDMGRGEMGRVSKQDEATRLLREAGIPGIKYLDQGSRAEGKGTYNYVVFDDRLVEILKKYGIAVTTAAGLADLQRRQQDTK